MKNVVDGVERIECDNDWKSVSASSSRASKACEFLSKIKRFPVTKE